MINGLQSSNQNIYINQGATFYKTLIVKNTSGEAINLSGISVQAKLKKYYGTDETFYMQTEIINAALGTISITMSAGQTINLNSSRYVYEIKLTDNNSVNVAFNGQALIAAGL